MTDKVHLVLKHRSALKIEKVTFTRHIESMQNILPIQQRCVVSKDAWAKPFFTNVSAGSSLFHFKRFSCQKSCNAKVAMFMRQNDIWDRLALDRSAEAGMAMTRFAKTACLDLVVLSLRQNLWALLMTTVAAGRLSDAARIQLSCLVPAAHPETANSASITVQSSDDLYDLGVAGVPD